VYAGHTESDWHFVYAVRQGKASVVDSDFIFSLARYHFVQDRFDKLKNNMKPLLIICVSTTLFLCATAIILYAQGRPHPAIALSLVAVWVMVGYFVGWIY